MPDEAPLIVVNANQRRHFEVLLSRLEESVVRIERLLDDRVAIAGPTLAVMDHDVPPAFHDHATPVLHELRRRIERLAHLLGVEPRRVSRRRLIAATLNAEAIRVEDSLSPQLRGYGHVDPSVHQHLDPLLIDITASLTELAAALRSRTQPSASTWPHG